MNENEGLEGAWCLVMEKEKYLCVSPDRVMSDSGYCVLALHILSGCVSNVSCKCFGDSKSQLLNCSDTGCHYDSGEVRYHLPA